MHGVTFIYALLAGLIPAFLWLFFWLREDRLHPEPRLLIFIAFLGGMLAVPLVLPFEQYVNSHITGRFSILTSWAFIEEFAKYLLGFLLVLRQKAVDEPIDPLMYMITIAIGFAALENTFFILKPLIAGDTLRTIVTSDLRFIGATLLHVVSSAVIGVSMALPFYRKGLTKGLSLMIGIIIATALHTAFNFYIMQDQGNSAFTVFLCVWAAVVILMLLFEEVKRVVPNGVIPTQNINI